LNVQPAQNTLLGGKATIAQLAIHPTTLSAECWDAKKTGNEPPNENHKKVQLP
jgi:hypothetical protein